MKNRILSFLLISLLAASVSSQTRYAGGDISLLPDYEKAGAQYKTHDGQPIADLLPWLRQQGMNAMRVRLFVNPSDFPDNDPNACQDLDYILPLCRQIKAAGFALLLDFHYSDTWADPAKQWTPKVWQGLTDEQLYQKIYDYTRDVLLTLKDNGVVPEMIQTGNEISFGMLWGKPTDTENQLKKTYMNRAANWDRLGHLLRQAGKACREVCPDAKIMLHTERVAEPDVTLYFYEQMAKLGVSYDIIGLSYYPYFHGGLDVIEKALTAVTESFPDKEVMIAETGYPYKWEVPGTTHDVTDKYPYSDEGQNKFMTDLVALLNRYDTVDGLFWWWLEYNAYGTSLANWYNAPLFDSTTGRATSALTTLCSFARGGAGVDDIITDSPESPAVYYDLMGRRIAEPSNGISIRVQDGRTTKIITAE